MVSGQAGKGGRYRPVNKDKYDVGYEILFESREIPTFPRYLATKSGRIYSGRSRKFLKPWASSSGHLYVQVKDSAGVWKKRLVHRLVFAAWAGPIPDGLYVCHNDGDAANNAVNNLRVDDQKGNLSDQLKHGTRAFGERNGQAKLKETDVLQIKKMLEAEEMSQQEIAKQFGVSEQLICDIKKKRAWKTIVVYPNFGKTCTTCGGKGYHWDEDLRKKMVKTTCLICNGTGKARS